MITLSTLKRAALTGTATLLLPATVFAATPQQTLNTAIRTNLKAPYRINGEIKIDLTDRPVVRTERTKTANVVMRFNQRIQNEIKGAEASEGTFTLASFRASGEVAGDPDITLDGPVTFEWKNVGDIAYFKIHSLPAALTDQLTAFGMDLSGLTNRWVKLDLSESEDGILSQLPLAPELPIDPTKGDMSLHDILSLSKIQPLTVVRVESRKTVAEKNILRLRVRVNSAFVSEMQRIERNKIGAKDPERTEKLKELTEKYTELRKVLATLHMAIEVDAEAQRITRIELGGRQTEPQKECTTNERTKRETCKVTSYRTMQYAVGINVEADSGAPVAVPTDAVDFMTLLQELSPEPEPEAYVEEEWDYTDEWELEEDWEAAY